uniref:SMP-30/Gluconolactonase/LRE-like region domain-containing protein n=1 Tax=Branchiostoma floridae TaxID=7739 RepID=C3YL15_BRAFL|eukprot:XP_002602994.1 hypothetical protein BRAFLDRAFT_84729 [Branchiostoma floridae]
MEPSVNPALAINNGGNLCTQPSSDTHQKYDEVNSMPANNNDSPCFQPYAVKQQQEVAEESVVETASNEDSSNSCLQPYAFRCLKPNGTVVESTDVVSADVDIKPYAVRYQEHEDSENDTQLSMTDVASDDEGIKPYAVRYQDHEDSGNGNPLPRTDDDGVDIKPYAVKYQEHDDSGNGNPPPRIDDDDDDDVNIEPYAAAYMDQDDITCETAVGDNQTKDPFQKRTAASNRNNDVSRNCAHVPGAVRDGQDMNEIRHAMKPMHMPNIQRQEAYGCTYHRMCGALKPFAVLTLFIVAGIFLWLFFNSTTSVPTTTVSTAFTTGHSTPDTASTPGHSAPDNASTPAGHSVSDTGPTTACNYSSRTTIADDILVSTTRPHETSSEGTEHAQLSSVSSNLQLEESHGRNATNITFGGRGEDPGQFDEISGMTVSTDNEIFVSDSGTKRVQVFDMNGLFLRSFTTVLPLEKDCKTNPSDIAVDGKGNVWAVDPSIVAKSCAHVAVQYSRDGQPMAKFKVGFRQSNVPLAHIAIDVRNHKIIVGAKDEIIIYEPNGLLVRRFVVPYLKMGDITSSMAGNILVTDRFSSVLVYSHSGVMLSKFGTWGIGQGQLNIPLGICVDTLGNIIVTNNGHPRVDMFTSSGEFVRTVANFDIAFSLWGIAVGPDGHLVLTYLKRNTVTIFPSHMVLLRPAKKA